MVGFTARKTRRVLPRTALTLMLSRSIPVRKTLTNILRYDGIKTSTLRNSIRWQVRVVIGTCTEGTCVARVGTTSSIRSAWSGLTTGIVLSVLLGGPLSGGVVGMPGWVVGGEDHVCAVLGV